MPATLCPSEEQLAAFQAGKLSLADLDQVAAHLATCALCQTALEAGRTNGDPLVQQLRQAQESDPFTDESGCQRAIARVEALANGDGTHTRDDTAEHVSPATLLTGTLGKYQLLELIGHGGMGEVYKAKHRLLNRIVAVKILPPHHLNHADAVARFRREIKAAGRLDHPHIVRASDADSADGRHFLVMEWLAGVDLAHYVKAHGPLSVGLACEFIRQAALGLDYAHKHGLVHRDVKPSNLYLTTGEDDGHVVKVLDLGLALLHDTIATEPELTSDGQVMGTYDFIAPEQALESHTVDSRADIYSLGCTFYYLLTGHTPFAGKSAAKKLLAHQLEEPTPITTQRSDLPAEVIDIVKKMMAKDPAKRHATMREVAEALDKVTEPANEAVTLSPRRPVKKPFVVAALFLAGLAAVVALTFGIIRIATPEGDYVIETDDPDFAFSVNKSTVILEDKLKKRTYHVRVVKNKGQGEWDLEITDPANALVFTAQTLTIKRGEQAGLKAWFEARKAAIAKVGPAADDAWLKQVAALTPEKQLEAVADKLKDLNPRFDGKLIAHKLDRDGVVRELEFLTDKVIDISPVQALTGLRTLRISGTRDNGILVDLSPLKDLRLTELNCSHTRVADLSPLAGMKLTTLYFSYTQVAELTPLQGMPLEYLDCSGTKVTSLSALKDAKLTYLQCHLTRIADLSPLKDMPLTLLDCQSTPVEDLTPLQGMKLGVLIANQTNVSNLTPLKDMPMRKVHVWRAKVSDLTPLLGMPLDEISCDFKAERDTAFLKSFKNLWKVNGKPVEEFWQGVDPTQKLEVGEIRAFRSHTGPVHSVAFAPDGQSFLSGGDAEIFLWDVNSSKEKRQLGDAQKPLRTARFRDHIVRIAFTKDGKQAVSGGDDQIVRVWDVEKGEVLKRLDIPKAFPPVAHFVALSPDDKYLLVAPAPSFVRLYAFPSLEESKDRYGGTQGHFARDGNKLLTLERNILQLYHLLPAKLTVVNVKDIHHCALSPDGRYAVAGGLDSMVYVWDMVAKKQLHMMKGHKGTIQALAISPDGKRALSGGGDQMLRLWDLDAGKELKCFEGHTAPVVGVAFSPDGRRALSAGGTDKTVRLWRLPEN